MALDLGKLEREMRLGEITENFPRLDYEIPGDERNEEEQPAQAALGFPPAFFMKCHSLHRRSEKNSTFPNS